VRANNRKLTKVLNNLSAYCSRRSVIFSKIYVKTNDCSTVLLADNNLIVQKIANKVAVVINSKLPSPFAAVCAVVVYAVVITTSLLRRARAAVLHQLHCQQA
jgi:hypothetical protein